MVLNQPRPVSLSDATTAYLHCRSINKTDGTGTADVFKAGYTSSKVWRALIFCTIPQIHQAPSACTTYNAPYDTGLSLKNVIFRFQPTNIDDTNDYYVYYIPYNFTKYGGLDFPMGLDAEGDAFSTGAHLQPYPVNAKHTSIGSSRGDTLDMNLSDATFGTNTKWIDDWVRDATSSPTDATDYGFGPNGIVDYLEVGTNTSTFHNINTSGLIKSKSLSWGDSFCLMVMSSNEGDANYIEAKSGSPHTTIDDMDMLLEYDDPAPAKPIIKLSADTDYIGAVINYQTKSTGNDILKWEHVFKTGGADTKNNTSTVNYNSSGSFNTTIYDFGKDKYKQNDGDIHADFLDTAGTTYRLVSYASDQTSRRGSNMVTKTRMTCSGARAGTLGIGEKQTITITGSGGDYSGKFVKFGINWDGAATAANDSLSDYNIVTLDEAATTATAVHTYDKSQNPYYINIFTIDADGFRSDFTRAVSAVIPEGTPVAKLRRSRDTAITADYADEYSVVTASAAQSYTVGSDKMIFAYLFGHASAGISATAPCTTWPTRNDNTGFNATSKTVKMKCNIADCGDTAFYVHGRISVTSDGSNVADTADTFSHYEQTVITLKPHTLADTYGSTAGTNVSNEFFKSVDFVVCNNKDAQDVTKTYYTLGDSDGNVINNQLRVFEESTSGGSWGGYVDGTANITELNFNAGAKTITRDAGSGDFISNGLAVGDKIYVSSPEDAANNSFFTINTLTATVITVDEDVTTNAEDTTAKIYKVNGPTLSFAALDAATVTIDCLVKDAYAAQTTTEDINTSSAVSQDVVFKDITATQYLDLDSLADSGDIAIENVVLQRRGGLSSFMPLGNSRYPSNTVRTRLGQPSLNVSMRVLTQAGYRKIWNLIEGDRYLWATIDSKKVDVPGTAYKQLRMKMSNGAINKDPAMTSQYKATCSFTIIGELVAGTD